MESKSTFFKVSGRLGDSYYVELPKKLVDSKEFTLDIKNQLSIKIDGSRLVVEPKKGRAVQGLSGPAEKGGRGQFYPNVYVTEKGFIYLLINRDIITSQDFPLDLTKPVVLRTKGDSLIIAREEEPPEKLTAPSNRPPEVFCHVCGMKNPGWLPFCRSCRANLILDFDLSTSYYQTGEALSSFHQLLDMTPLSTLTNLFLDKLGTKWVEAQLLGNAVRVSEKQYPQFYEVAKECAMILGVPRMPKVYIEQNMLIMQSNAEVTKSLGSNDDPLLVINSYIAGRAEPEELKFLIGREMGNIKCGHPLYLTIGEILRTGVSASLGFGVLGPLLDKIPGDVLGSILVDIPLRAAMNAWVRATHYVADRAGLLVLRDMDVAKQVMAKTATSWVLKNLSSALDIEEFISQADDLDESIGRFAEYTPQMSIGPLGVPNQYNPGYAIPFTVKRLRSLLEYYQSPEYKIAANRINSFLRGEKVPDDLETKTPYCGYCGAPMTDDEETCSSCGKLALRHAGGAFSRV